MDFYYYLVILIGIEFGIKFSLELGTVLFCYSIVRIRIGRTRKRNWNRIAAIAARRSFRLSSTPQEALLVAVVAAAAEDGNNRNSQRRRSI